ncbi:mitochondrial K+-H+ exchange-related-domain-containing protein [Coprinopsis sp. MPI-PUGE-AT-0042]|nr:mitochondrial K+-H+ exchange-related-domain-containing protein [Coprinopsis sp. MPI-PUGE-AT-0042]
MAAPAATAAAQAVTRLGLRQPVRARIIALPLVRKRVTPIDVASTRGTGQVPTPATPGSSTSTIGTLMEEKEKLLTYYQFQLSSSAKEKLKLKAKERAAQAGEKEKKGWLASKLPEEGIPAYAQTKAANLWASFGRAEGGWKLKVFQLGERAMDRIDFEELALKSVDPSLGPSLPHPKTNVIEREKRESELSEKDVLVSENIPLLYPPSITTSHLALAQLKAYTTQRMPLHRKGFYTWAIIAPFMAPFMIIPVIPNLPFFFCVWRSWSHYKAWRSSQYLQALLDQGRIVPEAREELDSVYENHPPSSSSSPSAAPSSSINSTSTLTEASPSSSTAAAPTPEKSSTHGEEKYERLLSKHAIPPLLSVMELDTSAEADLYRAVEQARVRIEMGKVEL